MHLIWLSGIKYDEDVLFFVTDAMLYDMMKSADSLIMLFLNLIRPILFGIWGS